MNSEDILKDYTNRTIKEVINPRWSNEEHLNLTVDVLFEELENITGIIPFTTHENADTRHGVEIWENALKGYYGVIKEFTPLPIEDRRSTAFPISRLDFRLKIKEIGITTKVINSAIASIEDEDKQEEFQIIWEDAQSFNRLDPFVIFIFEFAGLEPEQADSIWNI